MAAVLVDEANLVLTDAGAIEPLGPGPEESKRQGRVERTLQRALREKEVLRLYYRDLLGGHHRIDAEVSVPASTWLKHGRQFKLRYSEVKAKDVPREVDSCRSFLADTEDGAEPPEQQTS